MTFTNNTVAQLNVVVKFENTPEADQAVAVTVTEQDLDNGYDIEDMVLTAYSEQSGNEYFDNDNELIFEKADIVNGTIGTDILLDDSNTLDQVDEVLSAIAYIGVEITTGYIDNVWHNDIEHFQATQLREAYIGNYHSDRDFIQQTSDHYGIPVDSYDMDTSDIRHDHWTIAVTGGVAAFLNI